MKIPICKVCKKEYEKTISSMQKVCSPSCALALNQIHRDKVKAKDEKSFRDETRRLKKQLNDNDRGKQVKLCQKAFNRYIRARDKGHLCISCGAVPKTDGYIGSGGVHAGHYKSVGAHPELRFEELNVHNQCARCNEKLSGNIVNYRPALIEKIGADQVDWLEGPHKPKKYPIEELKTMATKYNKLARELENEAD